MRHARIVSFKHVSSNRKLSQVKHLRVAGQEKPRIVPPATGRVSSLYLPVNPTCPAGCPFKNNGCYAQAGNVRLARRLDEAAAGMSAEQVVRRGADAIDRAFTHGVPQDGAHGGRDLRLLESGDVANAAGARALAGAAQRWLERGGGTVWAYTHWWREIPREAFGPIKIAASVETVDDADKAHERGFLPALVVPEFQHAKPYTLEGSRNRLKLIPCPFETKGKTCAECRLCLDRTPKRAAIGFAAHGPGLRKVKEQLVAVNALVQRGTHRRKRTK